VAENWSVLLAELLIRTATVRTLRAIGLAAIIDGVISLIEGWAIYRRLWWSGWLIVCTTSVAIPLEGIAIVRHPSHQGRTYCHQCANRRLPHPPTRRSDSPLMPVAVHEDIWPSQSN
jgi:hypothetical protein